MLSTHPSLLLRSSPNPLLLPLPHTMYTHARTLILLVLLSCCGDKQSHPGEATVNLSTAASLYHRGTPHVLAAQTAGHLRKRVSVPALSLQTLLEPPLHSHRNCR